MTSLARKILLYLPVLVVLGFIFICYTPDVYADELLVGSGKNGNTKATNNINTWVDRNWDSSPSYSDSSWNNPIIFTPSSSNWDGWWQEFSYTPNGSDPGTSYSTPKFPFFNRSSANVIQNGSIRAPNGQKNYFRTKYKLPAGSTINNARVYVGVDDFAQIKLNGETVDFSPYASRYGFSSASRYDSGCNPLPVNQWVDGTPAGATGGALNYIASSDVTGTLRNVLSRTSSGADDGELIDLLISAEILNACIVDGSDSPLGVQYALYIDYTPPKNDPPVCGTVTKSPNQTSYLPSTSVTFTSNAADPEEKTLYYSWLPSSVKGVFIGNLTNKQITYRTPSTPLNEAVRYIVSDGVNQKECSFNLSTQSKFKCQENTDGSKQCILDPNGNYSDPNTCSINCTTKYSCNLRTNSCEVDPSGVYSTKPSCESDCKGDVSCSDTFIFTPNSDNTSATVTNSVNNFSSIPVSYTWSSTYSSSSFADCTRANTCFASAGSNTTLPLVTYRMPPQGQEDTITLNLGNGTDICTYEVGGKDITLDIEKSNYTTSVGGTVTARLIVTPTSTFNEPYNIYLNCPGQICRFKDIAIGDGLQRQIDYSKIGERKTQVFDFTITGVTPNAESLISANGYATVANGDNYTRSDTALVNVTSAKSLSVEVKETSSYSSSSPLDYCENFSNGDLVNRDSITKVDIRNGPTTSFYNGDLPLPVSKQTIPNGDYTFYVTGNEPGFSDSKEVYCTKVITDSSEYDSQRSQSSFTLTSSDTSVRLIAVVGPKISTGWFKAFGGNGYAFDDFSSKVPLGQRLFDIYGKITDGFVTLFGENANFSGLDPSRSPKNYLTNYEKQIQLTQFRSNFEQAYSGPDFTGSKTITSLDQIDKSSDKSIFYVYKGDLTFDNNFEINPNAKTPVLYVKSQENGNGGSVVINEDVQKLDLYIIADKDVLIGSKQTTCSPEKEKLSTSAADYRVHTFRRYTDGDWTSVSFRSTIPVVGDLDQPGDRISGSSAFVFEKPSDANYSEVTPYWVQSGGIRQDNEFIKYTTTLNNNDGEKSVICGDIDGDTDPLTWPGGTVNGVDIPAYPNNINKQYECGETISGSVTSSNISVVPTFPEELVSAVCTLSPTNPSNNGCNGSSVANVEVTWYKVTTPDSSQCSNTLNLQVRGAIIANQSINITPNSPNTQQISPSEEFYYSPDALFSDDDSADGFKVVNIYLKSLD